ncbi:hypothetical protein [Pseudoflavitalea rhizosphaerae]|uniref:hypothetical protein n=1 Tax=Pseudoflavitalea rhizosphaerae TaxID=1884793 RepID=UPI000F8D9FBB|nr:hypothetical protein [Pseudoflavitalea rhizosphaerae]
MKKQFIISILALLLLSNMLYASGKDVALIRDTLPADKDVMVFRSMPSFFPWLRFDVEISSGINSQAFETETRHYQIHNGQYSIQRTYGKLVQNYSHRFTVDTVSKVVAITERKNVLSAIMFFNFDNGIFWERHIQRMYAVDSGSLRKLVMEFKPESPWEKYIVVYDPVEFLPKQIRYTMKKVNSSGQREDDEYICDFKNYQTTAFDESVFSNEPYFKRVDGKPMLTETYSNYFLHISERSK